jgi:tRNA dimethylallyltransferase
MSVNPLLVVLGPTASGKTRLAVKLALELNGEIISADSRQVFKGMDIGTGKDLKEYYVGGSQVPHHLIDIKEPGEKYQVDAFKEDFFEVFEGLNTRKKLPILCGGSGMYIHSILQNHYYTSIPVDTNLREQLAHKSIEELRSLICVFPEEFISHTDFSSTKRIIRGIEIASYLSENEFVPKVRPLIKPLVIGLGSNVDIRRNKIFERLEQRLSEGLIEEVENLIRSGVAKEVLTNYGLEYKFVVSFLSGEYDLDTLKELLFNAIAQYSKRQMTFFRKMERDGVKIHWLPSTANLDFLKDNVKLLCKETLDR